MKVGTAPTLLYRPSPKLEKLSLKNSNFTSASAQAALVHRDVSHKAASRNSINSANIKGLRATPLAIILRSLWRPLSSDYKLQYTTPTIHTIIITRSISQSVFSINQAKPDITAKIIIVIIIATNNFTRSITLYRLQSKFSHLHYHKTPVPLYTPFFLIHYI